MQKKSYIGLGFTILAIVFSCTKLDTEPYHFMLRKDYKPTAADIGISYISPVYSLLRAITGSNQPTSLGDVYQENSFCTDEALIPTRGGDWYDGGHFQRLFEHTWTSETPDMNTLWLFSYNVISTANQNINEINLKFPDLEEVTTPFIKELNVVRSFGYYYLMDFFGNVPIVTKYDSTHSAVGNNVDFAAGRQMLFDTIVSNVTTSIPYLTGDFDETTFGSFNKWSAFALLAKMYINAEVWTGTSMYDECIAVCDSIINSNLYSIASSYFSNFVQNNQGSQEIIFAIPYNQNSTEYYEGFYFMGHQYDSPKKYHTANAPWNGFCALPDHYDSFDSTDVRRNGWIVGPQFASDNTTPLLLGRAPYVGLQLNYTADFVDVYGSIDTLDYANALENNGARLVKYEIAAIPHTSLGVPLAIFRYADILMLKAEALMRKNGGTATAEAVDLVNQVRDRTGLDPYATGTLTMDELLAERGREFYYEGIRRQDLVRFGKFVRGTWGRNFSGPYQDQWYDRSAEGDYRNVFPIPSQQMSANPDLTQNPGY